MPPAQGADVVLVVRLVLVLLASTLLLTGCAATAPAGDDPQVLARSYVSAINARDGKRVCTLMTKAATAELRVRESDVACDRTVAGFIGYVEDAGMPQFLRYRLSGVRSGVTRRNYSSIRLSLEARRRSTDGRQAFETCSFEDTVWLTRDDDELRIAKPSLALYVAFGATSLHDGALAPPGVAPTSGEERQLDCKPEKGVRPNPDAPVQSLAGLAALLARESSASDVRCFEGNAGDGWDVICTYFDATMGNRMKLGYRVGPGEAITGSGSVPEDMPLPGA